MSSYDPNELRPYRVEWRDNLTTGWLLINAYETHDEGRAGMEGALKQHKGQVRLITQHVIEAKGLGA